MSKYVMIEVDSDSVLNELSDNDLIKELNLRRIDIPRTDVHDEDKLMVFVKYQDYFTSLELESLLENNKPVTTVQKEQLKLL